MEEMTKEDMFVEFDKKTGLGDLLFVSIEPEIMHYRFCRIRDYVKECFFLEFDDRDNNRRQRQTRNNELSAMGCIYPL